MRIGLRTSIESAITVGRTLLSGLFPSLVLTPSTTLYPH